MAPTSSTDDATVTAVAASATAVTLFAAAGQVSRREVFNDSAVTLYLKYGSAAATNSFTTKVGPQTLYEFPGPIYTGLVTGLWDSATGSAYCTEVS
jgi:hypothetical protein